jgi:hypothetical protein
MDDGCTYPAHEPLRMARAAHWCSSTAVFASAGEVRMRSAPSRAVMSLAIAVPLRVHTLPAPGRLGTWSVQLVRTHAAQSSIDRSCAPSWCTITT